MAGTGSKVFKYGCGGCLGILCLLLLVGLVVGGLAWKQSRDVDLAEDRIAPDLPAAGLSSPPAPAGSSVDTGGKAAESRPDRSRPTDAAGKVVLLLEGGGFEVKPAAPGESIHLDASYDRNAYELQETLAEPEGGPWEYKVAFRQKNSGWFAMLRQMFSSVDPKVTVYLPAEIPLALDVKANKGGMELELGDLWITEADMDLGMGGMVVSFSRPLKAPMERLRVRASMGGFAFRQLGNASPRNLELDLSMGGGDVDLEGRWVVDSDIHITSSMGGCNVRLPRDVVLEGLDRKGVVVSGKEEVRPPTLRFTVDGDPESIQFN